jgi:hypothetical protein
MTAQSSRLTLEIERVLAAARSVVFVAFSSPDEVANGGPGRLHRAESRIDRPQDPAWARAREAPAMFQRNPVDAVRADPRAGDLHS